MNKGKWKLGLILLGTVILFLAGPTFAERNLNIEDKTVLGRSYIEANRKTIVAINLDLTEEESKNFWPVYKEYRELVELINDDYIELLKDYAQNYQDLSDRMAVNLLNDYLNLEMDRVASKKAYIEEFSKVLPSQKVAQYFQIENKMDAIIKADLAIEIPLIEPK